jgi:hypothetical protein
VGNFPALISIKSEGIALKNFRFAEIIPTARITAPIDFEFQKDNRYKDFEKGCFEIKTNLNLIVFL